MMYNVGISRRAASHQQLLLPNSFYRELYCPSFGFGGGDGCVSVWGRGSYCTSLLSISGVDECVWEGFYCTSLLSISGVDECVWEGSYCTSLLSISGVDEWVVDQVVAILQWCVALFAYLVQRSYE